jgi:Protein of unknwon function (DUF3310)
MRIRIICKAPEDTSLDSNQSFLSNDKTVKIVNLESGESIDLSSVFKIEWTSEAFKPPIAVLHLRSAEVEVDGEAVFQGSRTEGEIDRPPHYQGAVLETREILTRLGVPIKLLECECIAVIEQFPSIYGNFHFGKALEYLWQCGQKDDRVTDLQAANWYLQRYLDYCNPGNRCQIQQAIAL